MVSGMRVLVLGIKILVCVVIAESVSAAESAGFSSQNNGFWHAENEQAADLNEFESGSAAGVERQARKRQEVMNQSLLRASSKIRALWPAVEISGKSKWVEYSEDLQVKRVVDYAENEIRISTLKVMSRSSFRNFSVSELGTILSTTLRQALAKDFLFQSSVESGTAYGLDALVLAELFSSVEPGKREVGRRAEQLMQRAYIRYRDQLASTGAASQVISPGKMVYVIPMPKSRLSDKAREYIPIVRRYSKRFEVPADLIMAIMHTESHFNPLARSRVPAFGLMQIVPRTAGRDASNVLYKEMRLLSPRFLYNPENNVKVGSAYLSLVHYKYLKHIKDIKSRLYCTIASYNTGSANVALAFIAKPQMRKAVKVINGLSRQQVLERLIDKLPQRETREYVEKVLKRRKLYQRV